VSVECSAGRPAAVLLHGGRIEVVEILDRWLVEDDWWRTPLARRYLQLLLSDGRVITLFEDLIAGGWYQQQYGGRIPSAIPTVGQHLFAGSPAGLAV
jgi:hypothetical protein